MKALQQYGKVYLTVILCFALAALLAATATDRVIPVSEAGNGDVIYLDPGHGGEDGGAISVTGVQESGINLEISLRLRDLLHFCGKTVKMTRNGDYAIYDDGCDTIARKKSSDLRNRVALLQEAPGAILVSIHENQFSDGQYHGAQVFYNQASNSEALAKLMQEQLRLGLDPTNHREIKKSEGVYLMEHIENTAILVECGFLSNREEEEKLRDASYQKKIACAIGSGLMEYLKAQSTV